MMVRATANSLYKFENFVQARRRRIERLLDKYLVSVTDGAPLVLADAMRHVVLSGGKRLRSLLIYAVGEMYNVDPRVMDAPACAIEMVHSFSLVHDDLPAMDNDSLRRGKPTCHIAFNEATAILAGDALAVVAFQILSTAKLSAEMRIRMCGVLAEASGPKGMAGGQYIDLHGVSGKPSREKLEHMYLLKTGALIYAAIKLGAIAAGIEKNSDWKNLDIFAFSLGLAFQIEDDILNITSSATKLGKNVGTDSFLDKTTYPSLVGVQAAKARVAELWKQADLALQKLSVDSSVLKNLADQIMERDC